MGSILAIMASAIRFSIPYTLAGLGGTYSERSGVVNIGLEGMMLIGAFTAVAVANATGSAWLGLLAAIFAGMLLGVIHGVVCVTFKADQIVSGLAIIIFAAGITVFFAWLLFNQTQIKSEAYLRVPLLHDIPAFILSFSKPYSDCDCARWASIPRQPTHWESVWTKCATPGSLSAGPWPGWPAPISHWSTPIILSKASAPAGVSSAWQP